MFEGNELKHLSLIPGRLQPEGTQGIRDHLRFLPEMDPKAEQRPEHGGAHHLRPEFFVATRSAHDDFRPRLNPHVDRQIGGGVTGMQGNHDLD